MILKPKVFSLKNNYFEKRSQKKYRKYEQGEKGTNLRTGDVRSDSGSESDSSQKECPISAKGIADTTAMIALSLDTLNHPSLSRLPLTQCPSLSLFSD